MRGAGGRHRRRCSADAVEIDFVSSARGYLGMEGCRAQVPDDLLVGKADGMLARQVGG